MKKSFLILLVCALGCMACKGPVGPEGPMGPRGYSGEDGKNGVFANKEVIHLEVNAKTWQYSNIANNNYFSAGFEMPEINAEAARNGAVVVYREYNVGENSYTQTALPYTRQKEIELIGESGESNWYFYTEHVDYEYGVGFLNVFFTVSDFDYELDTDFVPEDMLFRVVIYW